MWMTQMIEQGRTTNPNHCLVPCVEWIKISKRSNSVMPGGKCEEKRSIFFFRDKEVPALFPGNKAQRFSFQFSTAKEVLETR